jgi:hypothetical protein
VGIAAETRAALSESAEWMACGLASGCSTGVTADRAKYPK